ncbi:four helix bundle protein [Marivirga arenosa]|uniref:Four helix bundle protein n=1 Tax=Marivirga arenosa TaxID=3059076 RepID=A0AA49JE73_9BACT|nr:MULTISPECIES: four helix bundle protein [unclassified Marivirga]WKK82236.1 four helix bundle protein [Marivirga sp. BKB1-2]WKK87046.1 four helix bundle protein [Marivirga sp. ABR2-2]
MHKFQDLQIWKQSMNLAEIIYKITSAFPNEEKFGLTSQMKRSAVSIPSNIAEGAGRNNPKEFYQFLGIALGSLAELETQSNLSNRLSYINEKSFEEIIERISEIRRMTYSLQQKLI